MALRGLFGKGVKDAAPPATPLSGDDTTLAPSPAAASLADEKMQPTTTATAPESRPQSHDGAIVAAEKDPNVAGVDKKEEEEEEVEEDETEYPKAAQLALISIALCLSVFCMALDNTIITTAIPRITDQFKAINDVGWYGSAYLLTT